MDASPIIDHGMAYKYMVKYASKGESRSRDAQRLLARLVRESAGMDEGDDNRLSLQQILRRVLQTCTTRRDMGAQEVMHLLMQTPSVHHNLEFVITSTVVNNTEVVANNAGGLWRRAALLEGYARRSTRATWVRQQDVPQDIQAMPYSEFAARFRLTNDGRITALTGRNRVVSFQPFVSCNPRGPRYHEYCRNSLVKFKAWEGELWEGWGGAEGELACTDDAAAKARMITNWEAFRGECLSLDPSARPRGFSARDANWEADRQRNRRRRREGQDEEEGSSEGSDELGDLTDGELSGSDGDDDNLDGIHGAGGPLADDDVLTRRWADGRDGQEHDWGNGRWAERTGVRVEDARSWVSHTSAAAGAEAARAAAAAAESAAGEGITGVPILPAGGGQLVLNEKLQLAVDIVVERAAVEIEFSEAAALARRQRLPPPEDNRGPPLRMVMSGTAGTGKTVAIREMLRRVGHERFLVMAPTGNAACALPRGQVRRGGRGQK